MSTSPENSMQENISAVIQASKLPAKRRSRNIKPTVELLASQCYDKGLLPDDLNQLVDLVTTPNFLDQASLASIVRNLYPATHVNPDLVIKVVGSFGHGKLKPSLAIQGALLKWLIMVHHVMETQTVMSQLYPVLFNLLDTAAIRPQLCHLLALITRRRHVRPHRIQSLLSLSRQIGNDPALTGLLRVFKDYYPEIIVGEATRGKASAFKHPDPQWREHLDEIQRAHEEQAASRSQRPLEAFRVARQRLGGKKSAPVPEVHTSHATEQSVTLEEIESVDGFVKRLEIIELPNQLISVLADPLLQKFMLLRPQAEAQKRASSWLTSYVQDVMSGDSEIDLTGILEIMKTYVSAVKILPPVFLTLFSELLRVWDGQEGRNLVLDVLSYAPLFGFHELYPAVFKPLEMKVLDNTAESQLEILGLYTTLLRRWMTSLGSISHKLDHAPQTIAGLVNHVNDLSLTVIQTSPTYCTHSQVLDFYEQTAILASSKKLLPNSRIVIPPSPLVYILHFGTSPATASRLYDILAKYKIGFQTAMANSRTNYGADYINQFNGFLMDICNCLWRSRAFNNTDVNSHGCLVSRPLVESLGSYIDRLSMGCTLNSAFSLSFSPTFGLFAISYMRELEDAELERDTDEIDTRHAGPVTRASLKALDGNGGLKLTWDDYRLGLLDYFERRGLPGVAQLMNNTMTTLMRRRSTQASE
ncbi:Mis6-domain-containing protein [Xylariomycetidae sp. FL2044]|nr:Mis6-domain-containing protein [Xylariomycetidae sp. FL2044]